MKTEEDLAEKHAACDCGCCGPAEEQPGDSGESNAAAGCRCGCGCTKSSGCECGCTEKACTCGCAKT